MTIDQQEFLRNKFGEDDTLIESKLINITENIVLNGDTLVRKGMKIKVLDKKD